MIKLTGITLRVKTIHQGRYGNFCVADLSTDIGEFKVKDPLLDQFEDGEYTGTVWISEIRLSQYMAWGKAVTEIRAVLHDLSLDGVSELKPDNGPSEPDPAEEVPPPAPMASKPAQAPPTSSAFTHGIEAVKERLKGIGKKATQPAPVIETPRSDDAQLAQLFGELWLLICDKQPVKFDPTVDRLILRQQTAAVRELGYKFMATDQTWYPV